MDLRTATSGASAFIRYGARLQPERACSERLSPQQSQVGRLNSALQSSIVAKSERAYAGFDFSNVYRFNWFYPVLADELNVHPPFIRLVH